MIRNKRSGSLLLALCVIFAVFTMLFASCSVQKLKTDRSERVLFGTLCSITVYGSPYNSKKTSDALNRVWDEMYALEKRISCRMPDSELYKYNHGEISTLNSDSEYLLSVSLKFKDLTGGSFSPYVAALSELWGIGTDSPRVPSDEEIQESLTRRDLDFGAVGKGYASDIARELLKKEGFSSAVVDFGGNIALLGGKPTGAVNSSTGEAEVVDFVVGIQLPDEERGEFRDVIRLRDACVVSSGDYERYFLESGTMYSHIFDVKTGYPAHSGLRQVTVIGPEGVLCDALSTSLFIAGEEAGEKIIAQFPGYRALYVHD